MKLSEAIKQVENEYQSFSQELKDLFIGIQGHGLTITKEMIFSDGFGISMKCDNETAEAVRGLLQVMKPGKTYVSDGDDTGTLQ